MELSNSIIFNEAFFSSFNRIIKKEFSSIVSLKMVKFSKELYAHTKDVFSVRDSLLNRYKDPTKSGNVFKSKEDEHAFFKQMDELLANNFEVSLKEKFIVPQNIDVSPEDILNCESIIDIDKSLANMELK